MEKIKKVLPLLLLLCLIVVVYRAWFGSSLLTGGDIGMTFHSMYFNNYLYPFAWYWNQGTGLGGNAVALLLIYLDFALFQNVLGQIMGLRWEITERVAYFFPFLILGASSSIVFAKSIFPKNPFRIFSTIIFLTNTYILMVVGGGQLWIFLSYTITPAVLYFFIKEINLFMGEGKRDIRKPLLLGLIFSFQFLLDLRIAYITLFAILVYWIFAIWQKITIKHVLISFCFFFLIPISVTFFTNAFWIVPTVLINQNPLRQFGSAYTSQDAVTYFSFAKFEDTISLLHPNWWENIFGKIGFLRPEFLLLPILAFSSLFFITSKKGEKIDRYILFFALLGVVGAFLAKGANDPFGGIYLWMFGHIPGFVLFRDPTKWYLLIVISYSALIPFTLWKIYEWIQTIKFSIFNFQFSIKSKIFNFQNLFILCVSCYLLFLIHPAFSGQLGGTFKSTQLPNEYAKLEAFLSSQNNFYRTFWIPSIQRFALNSKDHPATTEQAFSQAYDFSTTMQMLKTGENILQDASIKYVIVPYDSEGEIFMTNRKYDDSIYKKTIQTVRKISYLKQVYGFGKIGVFEVPNPKDHFWSVKENIVKSYTFINPTKYRVIIQNAKKGDVIVFSESYDPRWIVTSAGNTAITSTKYNEFFNSFILKKDGSYALEVYYTPQKYVDTFLVISLVCFFTFIAIILYITYRKNDKLL